MKVQTTGRILLFTLFHRKKVIIGFCMGILGTIFIGSLLWPPIYEASSSVVIQSRDFKELLFPFPKGGGERMVMAQPKDEINSEIEIIQSRPVLERVVTSLNLHVPREFPASGVLGTVRAAIKSWMEYLGKFLVNLGLVRGKNPETAIEEAVIWLKKCLRIEPSIDSMIIRVIYRDYDPLMASKVANNIVEEYLRQHLALNLNRAESSFYGEQLRAAEAEMYELQSQLAKMKSQEGIISFAEQSKALLEKYKTFDVARTMVQKEIISKQAKVEAIQKLRKSNPEMLIPLPEIAQNPMIEDMENRLIQLTYQLGTLQQRYKDDTPQVMTTREQGEQTRTQIRKQVDLIIEREIAEFRKFQAEEQALTKTLEALDAQIKRLPAIEIALANSEKKIEDKEIMVRVLRKKYEDSLVTGSADSRLQNVKVISSAFVPITPVAPNMGLNMGLGLILALVVSFSVAFFLEHWDDSIRMPEDVERYFGLKVFASVPELET